MSSSAVKSLAKPKGRLPFVVLLLAAGTFLMSTTEFVIAGLLPDMAADLNVSVSQAGLLITAFAVGMIVGAPTISVATMRLPKRLTLVLSLLLFAVGHIVAAISPVFEVVLIARVLTALATGAFLSVAAVVATSAAGPSNASRAMGVMMSGMGLAIVAGVPLGSFVGQLIGWRGIFWALAVLALVAAVIIGRFAPAEEAGQQSISLRSQLGVLRSGKLWLVLLTTALVSGGFLAAYSYISPLLTDRTGIDEAAVPLLLVGFGIGALLGTVVAGRTGDRAPLGTYFGIAGGSALVLLLLIPLSPFIVPTAVLVILLGFTGMGVTAIATPLAVRFGHSGPSLSAALTVSAFNVGIAAATWLAGVALDSPLGTTGPSIVGAAMAIAGLIPLLVLAAMRATRRTPAPEQTDAEKTLERDLLV
ncbi:MFS transporter [uncultured Microbacterium sp.]|uniref:MFS transporter n=1 Tax=uncultured Microbacterium sp. TaxID=191216 RepID=UPI0028D6894C|nr:MFS transporter [uncultured Microbacterium sp.]